MRNELLRELGVDFADPGGWEAIRRIVDMYPLSSAKKALHFNCGPGTGAVLLAKTYGCRVTALDAWPGWLDEARRRAAQEGIAALVTILPDDDTVLPDSSFDLALVRPHQAISRWSRLWRALRWGGSLGVHGPVLTRELAPRELQALERAYGPMDTIEAWRRQMDARNYTVVYSDHLPEAVLAGYYAGLSERIERWRAEQGPHPPAFEEALRELEEEAAMARDGAFAYGVIVSRKLA